MRRNKIFLPSHTPHTGPKFKESTTSVTTVAKEGIWYNWTVTDDVKISFGTAEKKLALVLKSEDFHESYAFVSFYSRDQEYFWMKKYSLS